MNKDLTIGKPWSVLWRYCLPLFGSVIFQQLYNLADSFVAGKFLGEDALAAVGNSYEITLIFIAFAIGCNVGCSVIVAQFFGAKRMEEMKTSIYTTLIACGVLCAMLMTGGSLFSGGLLRLIRTPIEILDDSKLYLDIYIASVPFVFFYNVANGIFSALGDSRTPFAFLACSSTVNIAMDILFVTALDMGVDGVAWATFLCQGVSCLLAVWFVLRRLRGIQTSRVQAFSWKILRRVAGIALPTMLQQSFVSVGNIVIQGIINGFGPAVIAGYSASIKLNNMVISAFTTMSGGVSNYAAQNFGARKFERVHEGFRAGLRMVWMIAIPMAVVFFFAGGLLIHIFLTDPSPEALSSGTMLLKIVSPFYVFVSLKLISDAVLRGAGLMKQFMTGTFADLFLRVGLAMILSVPFQATGVWLSWPLGWIIGAGLSVFFYHRAKWETLFPEKTN